MRHRKRMVFVHPLDGLVLDPHQLIAIGTRSRRMGISCSHTSRTDVLASRSDQWQLRHLVGDHRMHLELDQDVIHGVALHSKCIPLSSTSTLWPWRALLVDPLRSLVSHPTGLTQLYAHGAMDRKMTAFPGLAKEHRLSA